MASKAVHVSDQLQEELQGQGTDSLRSLGICSGDTLWLMSAYSEPAQFSTTGTHAQPPTAASPSQGTDAGLRLPDCQMAPEGDTITEALPEAENTGRDTMMSPSEQARILTSRTLMPDHEYAVDEHVLANYRSLDCICRQRKQLRPAYLWLQIFCKGSLTTIRRTS